MNNIYILLYCLFLITFSSRLAGLENDVCPEYSRSQDNPGVSTQGADEGPFRSGILWKIEDDSGSVSYLFGTIHSQDRLVNRLPPPVRLALAQSNTLVMEVIPDPEANRIFLDSIYFKGQEQLHDLLDASVYERLQEQIADYGIDRKDASRLKPWAAFTLIGRPKPVRANTLEESILESAVSMDKAIYGLETMRELVDSLEGIPMQDQLEILNDTVCNHAQIIRDTRQLVQLYMSRDLAGMEEFNRQPHHDEQVFARFMEQILFNRNNRMLERMAGYLSRGKAFIAVGAAHLPGERGLLNGLVDRGYEITAVY